MASDVQSPRVRALVAWLAARQREAWEKEIAECRVPSAEEKAA